MKLVEEKTDLMYLRSEMHVNVMPVTQSVQDLMEGAYHYAHKLVETSMARQLTCMRNEDVEKNDSTHRSFHAAIESEIRRIALANEALQSSTSDNTQHSHAYSDFLIAMTFIREYAMIGTRLPGNT